MEATIGLRDEVVTVHVYTESVEQQHSTELRSLLG